MSIIILYIYFIIPQIAQIEREQATHDTVLAMDKKTMSEIRRYHNPPPMMHRVIQAALLLLGEDEITTSVST